MTITGALAPCVGETLRAEVTLDSGSRVWAIKKITTAVTSITLTFDATTGDFYNTKPTVTAGELVVAGTRVAPVMVTQFGQTTITIAKTWQ
jgi:hypothetical protein